MNMLIKIVDLSKAIVVLGVGEEVVIIAVAVVVALAVAVE